MKSEQEIKAELEKLNLEIANFPVEQPELLAAANDCARRSMRVALSWVLDPYRAEQIIET